jgi:hypothetical protein
MTASLIGARELLVICPSGGFGQTLSSPLAKNISLYFFWKSELWCTRPASARGAYRDRHEREAGCDGRDDVAGRAATLRTAKSCGPDTPTLVPSCAKLTLHAMTGARKPGPRGEPDISRKTIAQGRPDDPVEPVVTAACFF